ncbi:MAG: aldolase/citrate lyase family protein [bacterium]|nr:aldolase/citrate lyase family protein [bacterium]
MPVRLSPDESLAAARERLGRPLIGIWVCSGSPLVAEICAGSGADWLFFDAEHSPNDVVTLLPQLQAAAGYPVVSVARPPLNDTAVIKQFLDTGVTTLIVPMVDTAEQAEAAARAVAYPPAGVRGVGSALARSGRWNRVPDYLPNARESLTLVVQIESVTAVENLEAIAAVEGVDALFVGPSDLAASMGLIGQQNDPRIEEAVLRAIEVGHAHGKLVGVNAFAQASAKRYLEAGADFISVGADVSILARGTEALVDAFSPDDGGSPLAAGY